MSELQSIFTQIAFLPDRAKDRGARPHLLGSDLAAQFKGYDFLFTKGRPLKQWTIQDATNIFKYAADRVHPSLWMGPASIQLISDPNYFLENKKEKQTFTPQARSRWYAKSNEGTVAAHVRGRTDLNELASLFGALELVREFLHDDPTNTKRQVFEQTFNATVKKHKSACERAGVVIPDNPYQSFLNGSLTILPFDGFGSGEKPINHDEEVIIYDENVIHLTPHSNESAQNLAHLVEQKLKVTEARPTTMMFFNDFTLPMMLSTPLLNEPANGNGETIRDYILNHIKLLNLPDLQTQLDYFATHTFNAKAKHFLQDVTLMAFINLYSGPDEKINAAKQKMSDLEHRGRIGITTLVEKDDSPTADPVLLADFGKIDEKYLQELPHVLQELVLRLKMKKLQTLIVPYALGDLTFQVGTELKTHIPSIQNIIEIGKVGAVSDMGTVELPVGSVVIPRLTGLLGQNQLQWLDNQGNQFDIPVFNGTTSGFEVAQIQAPSVLLQQVHQLLIDLPPGTGMTVSMEHDFLKALCEEHRLNLISFDYVSDHVTIKPEAHSIAKGLGPRGIVPVCEATFGALNALDRLLSAN